MILHRTLFSATSIFNHGHVVLPPAFGRLLRLILAMPDMHRAHHPTIASEADGSFGFGLSG